MPIFEKVEYWGLKDPLEVRVQHETCIYMGDTFSSHFEPKKIDRVGRRGQKQPKLAYNCTFNICFGVYPKLFLWTYLSKFSRHHLSKFAPNSSATGDKVQEEWCYCGTTSDELCESKILFLLPLFLMKFSACGKCKFKIAIHETDRPDL